MVKFSLLMAIEKKRINLSDCLKYTARRSRFSESQVVVLVGSNSQIGTAAIAAVFEQAGRLRAAVNQDMADDSTLVPERAEVAFFPPVTGG